MGGFFPGMLGDLLKLLQTDAPFPFELAEQLASTVAAEGDENANPDPAERIRLEGLLPLAELHVADVTGMSATASSSASGGRYQPPRMGATVSPQRPGTVRATWCKPKLAFPSPS